MVIKVERIYNNPRGNKTFRVLVDRLWPRGLSKANVKVDLWQKDIAPSNSLRKWFSHDWHPIHNMISDVSNILFNAW